jgi:TorA maturation chaperone TorD
MQIFDGASSEKLRQAVAAEKRATADSLALYLLLTEKIEKYQVGEGPAPTELEFTQWLAEVKRAVTLRKLLDGIPDT